MQINRLVFAGFWYGRTTEADILKLAAMGIGGVCIYGGDKAAVRRLCTELRAASPWGEDFFIAADYEDGLGRWLPDAQLLPSNLALGAADEEELAFEKGYITAREALALGVNWVFAPVVDLADNPQNPIVNTRAFGKDPHRVVHLARALMRGLAAGGALNSIKHFPGHGNTQTDSHLALPVIKDDLDALRQNALLPFSELLCEADSVMAGHLLVPALDAEKPASLSEKIIRGLLQTDMGYTKCVCTDALCMKALGDEREAALACLKAGAHILLSPADPFALIDFLRAQTPDEALLRRAGAVQDALARRSRLLRENALTRPYDAAEFTAQAARKALVRTGDFAPLTRGQKLHIAEIGNDEKLDHTPFLQALREAGIELVDSPSEADFCAVLFWRRYQAFKGKIGLSETEKAELAAVAAQAKAAAVICFSTPWLARDIQIKNRIYTFSPAPAFQREAARALCGQSPCAGKMPVDL